MNITEVKCSDGWLCIKTQPAAAYRFCMTFKSGEYDIKPTEKKRSRNANSYAWSLISQIAAAVGENPIDVYRNEVKEVCCKSDVLSIATEAVERFRSAFCENHLGRSIAVISMDEERAVILAVYGSSDFNSKEMTRFINHIVSECEFLGIETEDSIRIKAMIDDWEKKHG